MDEPRKNSEVHEGNSVVPIVIATITTTLIVVGIAWLAFYSKFAISPSAQLSSYYLEHGDYSVYFPTQPTYSLTSADLTKGNKVTINNYSWGTAINYQNVNYPLVATHISSPFANSNLTPEENLKNETEYTGNLGNWNLISSNPTTFHGFPAIDYVASIQINKSQPAVYQAGRDTLKGNDLYMLDYFYQSGQEDKQLENTFLNSLTFGKTQNNISMRSQPIMPSSSVGSLCNGTSYSACPAGQDFVCPGGGSKAYCQTEQQAQTLAPPINNTLSSVIEEWHPFIAYVVCNFSNADGSSYSIQGSGTISKTSGEIAIVTNKHVVTDSNGNAANSCEALFPLDANHAPLTWTTGNYQTSPTLDFATLPISNPSPYIKSLNGDITNRCPTQPPIGEEIAILGYPTNGSKTDITATEGIISGYDGDYYITSAKVDHGNSGGAAIDVKNDCFLGIPTYFVGDVESLARVLRWQSWY